VNKAQAWFVLLTALTWPLNAFAGVEARLWGGYTTVSMAKRNEQFDKIKAVFNDSGDSGSVVKFGSGWILGLDAGLPLGTNIWIGPRLEYLQAFSAKVDYRMTLDARDALGTYLGAIPASGTYVYDASLLPLLIGLQAVSDPNKGPFRVGAGLFAGMGFASYQQKLDSAIGDLSGKTYRSSSQNWAEGSCPMVDLEIFGRYRLADKGYLGLKAGYRMANVVQVTASRDGEASEARAAAVGTTSATGVWKKGDVLKSWDEELSLDFSGINLALEAGWTF
jgi:hypothetical protein